MERKEPPNKQVTAGDGEPDFSLLGVIRSLWQWRKPVIYVTLAAAVGAIVISLMLPTYYQATTSFLAINPDRLDPFVMGGYGNTKTPLYGNRNDIDRIMAIAESNELVSYLIDKYDLYERYEIDTTSPKADLYVRRKFFSLYEVTKTALDAIVIDVEDKDPFVAANLANDARNQIDAIGKGFIQNALRQNMAVLKQDQNTKEIQISQMADSLRWLRNKYEILDLETQSEAISGKSAEINQDIAGLRAKIRILENTDNFKGKRDSIAKFSLEMESLMDVKIGVDSQMRQLSMGMEPVYSISEGRRRLTTEKISTQFRVELYESALQSEQGVIITLEEATPPVIKSRPRRSFIVIGVTMAAFFFSILAVLAIEHSRQFDWKKITG
ncbi:hypothetical protein CEQ90_06780 [Lewinellaceae bacterium SD302]|nr:hypothetical protein CEQ90_06780 [Lewinellaceae bacterium SD302]